MKSTRKLTTGVQLMTTFLRYRRNKHALIDRGSKVVISWTPVVSFLVLFIVRYFLNRGQASISSHFTTLWQMHSLNHSNNVHQGYVGRSNIHWFRSQPFNR